MSKRQELDLIENSVRDLTPAENKKFAIKVAMAREYGDWAIPIVREMLKTIQVNSPDFNEEKFLEEVRNELEKGKPR
jgi:hypothetical protein